MAKILIVDDSPTDRHYLKEILKKDGHTVVEANDGQDGIDKSKSENPDLIVMDLVMPGINGFIATRTITRDVETAHIPVIICTVQETERMWGMKQGASDYIVKPAEPQYLIQKIKDLLKK